MALRKKISTLDSNQKKIIDDAKIFIESSMANMESGHDYLHIERVLKNARHIIDSENDGDIFIIELACLFHDIKDSKFNNGIHSGAEPIIKDFLTQKKVAKEIVSEIIEIVNNMSFSSGSYNGNKSMNFKIVQDADRLDAIGAIGIARVFHYSGFRNTKIYNSNTFLAETNYENDTSAVAHFYNKLLKLECMMNTKTGSKLAKKRTKILKNYLSELKSEIIL